MTKTSLVKGTAVLAAAGLFVKFLGAFFRIPLANMIGAAGMASYAPAYSLYNFLLVFSTAGIPVAVSKMVSERQADRRCREAAQVFHLSRMLMFMTGITGFGIVFLYAEEIAGLFHVPGASLSMRAMAPALFLVPLVASYRGYFQGMNNMIPTAVSQITEQIFRVAAGLTMAMFLKDNVWIFDGFTWQQRGAAGGCFGAAAGGLGGLLAILIMYLMVRRQLKERIRKDRIRRRSSSFLLLKRILIIALPVTLGAAIMPIVGLIDAGVVAFRLHGLRMGERSGRGSIRSADGICSTFDRVPSDIDPVGSRKSRASGGCCKAEKRCFYVERNAADGISDRHDPGNAVCDRTDRFSETDIAAAVSDTEGKCHSCGTLPAASWAWFSCPGHRTGLYRGTAGNG